METTRKPFSVALIGGDGAGKTTIARRLEQSFTELPVRYLYMGVNIESSNVALTNIPVVRAVRRLIRRSHMPTSCQLPTEERFWWGWFFKHVADEIYRQKISWQYRKEGYTVIYDRHFQFDFAQGATAKAEAFWHRLHCWFLASLYPSPDLVLFLDAPAEVLFSRKHESTIDHLKQRREEFLELGKRTPNFIRVNANRGIDEVYNDVVLHILNFSRNRAIAGAIAQVVG